jgi:SAM-dependent methyltransferase
MAAMTYVHPMAARGYSQGADTYVRGRPDFPPAAIHWLKDELHLAPGKATLELGAGTGKFTRLLVQTGADVTAVEPVAAMLEYLRHQLPGVRTLHGSAQNIPLPDASTDAVICAQSFHWFASAESLAEIRRVLKPGGMLGLIWNIRDESVDWIRHLDAIMTPYEGDAPRYCNGEWRRVFPAEGFGALREREFHHEHLGSAEQVIVDRVASVSFIAALDATVRCTVLNQVRALIASTPSLAGRAEVCVPYLTRAYWCDKLQRADSPARISPASPAS